MVNSKRSDNNIFRHIVENSPNALILVNPEGTITFINQTGEVQFGYEPDELPGQKVEVLLPGSCRGGHEAHRNSFVANPQKRAMGAGRELHARKKDGSEIPVEIGLTPIVTENGMLVLATVIDISEKQRAEKKFKAIIEQSIEAISLHNPDGTILYQSPGTQRMLGYTDAEAKEIPPANFFHPDDLHIAAKRLEDAIANPGVPIAGLNRMRRKDGQYIWTEGTATNFLQDDNIRAIIGNFRDVTEQKLATDNLKKLTKLYAVISQINQIIVQLPDEDALYHETCRICTEIGHFAMAWLGQLDTSTNRMSIACSSMMPAECKSSFTEQEVQAGTPQALVLQDGLAIAINDMGREPSMPAVAACSSAKQLQSCILLPIKKGGNTVATLNIYSAEINYFGEYEFRFLQEAARDLSFALDVFEKDRERKQIEEKIRKNEIRLKHAQALARLGSWDLDLESGQVTLSEEFCRIYSIAPTRDKFSHEHWVTKVHPDDREHVEYELQKAKSGRDNVTFTHRILNPNGNEQHIHCQVNLELNTAGLPITLFGIAWDVTEQKEAEQKILNLNRLYLYLSHINQTIVKVQDEATLYREACRIAIEFGKFELAWISMPDTINKQLNVVAHSNATKSDLALLNSITYQADGPLATVLKTNNIFIVNDFQLEVKNEQFRNYAAQRGFGSCIVLPITKAGIAIGAYNLISAKTHAFNDQEISLLTEATGDISFAITILEKDRERQEMENDLRVSQTRLKQAQSMARFGSWVYDFSSGVAVWSEEACKIYGIPAGENSLTTEESLLFTHPDDREYVMNMVNTFGNELKDFKLNHRIVRKDGQIRYIYSETQFELNEFGQLDNIYGILQDVTDAKLAELALAQSEANLRQIVDLIPQGIFAKNTQGKYLFANKYFGEIYGTTPEQLVNTTMENSAPSNNDITYFKNQDLEVLATGELTVIPEQPFIDFMGNSRIFHTVKVPYTMPGTHETVILGIIQDITQQKTAEKERNVMIADIVERNKNLEQFSYIVSHNLRAPLANIMGLTEVIQLPGIDNDSLFEFIGNLSLCANKLDSVIMDLNHILALKQGLNEQKELVQFSNLLSDIQLSIKQIILTEGVVIDADFTSIDQLYTSKSYLHSIFYNIITNSIKYRRSGVTPHITINSRIENEKMVLTFKDNGLGIDMAKNESSIFGLYKRFHNHVDGKGMGLYMIKTQVEALGGKIYLRSVVNEGSEFTVVMNLTNKQ